LLFGNDLKIGESKYDITNICPAKETLKMNIEKEYASLFLLNEAEEILKTDDIQPQEKLCRFICAQLRMIDEYPEAAQWIYSALFGLTKSENAGVDENRAVYFSLFKQIFDDGIRAGVFREMDGLPVSHIICSFCTLWGKSETVRSACKGSRENYGNFIMDILTYGIVKESAAIQSAE
jgi:hypothetical protein